MSDLWTRPHETTREKWEKTFPGESYDKALYYAWLHEDLISKEEYERRSRAYPDGIKRFWAKTPAELKAECRGEKAGIRKSREQERRDALSREWSPQERAIAAPDRAVRGAAARKRKDLADADKRLQLILENHREEVLAAIARGCDVPVNVKKLYTA